MMATRPPSIHVEQQMDLVSPEVAALSALPPSSAQQLQQLQQAAQSQHDTSDCGSSSGVGGMAGAASGASDEASSSSDQTPAVKEMPHPLSSVTVPLPLPLPLPLPSSSAPLHHHLPLHQPPPQPPSSLHSYENGGGGGRQRASTMPFGNRYAYPPPSLYGGGPGGGGGPPHLGPPGPPGPLMGSLMAPLMGAAPPPINNDIFVHVQTGETLGIVVGGEVQHITGPATVRMVGEAGAQVPQMALPLTVPKGHVVHQLLDDQGYLRHIILSPETARENAPSPGGQLPSTSTASNRPSPSTMQPLQHMQPNGALQQPPLYTVSRQYGRAAGSEGGSRGDRERGGRQRGGSNAAAVAAAAAAAAAAAVAAPEPLIKPAVEAQEGPLEPVELDQEDIVRIREMLNRIMPPTILRLNPTDVDIAWQELDTSEASSIGGPFPELEVSEFTYQILVQETGRIIREPIIHKIAMATVKSDVKSERTRYKIGRLTPNREYSVSIQARLEERGIQGDYSPAAMFKTPCGAPDPPTDLKADSVQSDSCCLRWTAPQADGGAAIGHYTVYRVSASDRGTEEAQPFMDTRDCAVRVGELKAGASYKFKVTASNRFGESLASPTVCIITRGEVLFIPTVATASARSAKISWPASAEYVYTVEQIDSRGVNTIIKRQSAGSWQYANELMPNTDYMFRVIAHSKDGGFLTSDWIPYKHVVPRTNGVSQQQQLQRGDPMPLVMSAPPPPPPATASVMILQTPAKPFVANRGEASRKVEIGWRQMRDVIYVLEGSSFLNGKHDWRQIYKGGGTSIILGDEHNGLACFRLQHQSKRAAISSDWSELLRLPLPLLKPAIYRIPVPLTPPVFSEVTKHSMRIRWPAAEDYPSSPLLPGTTVLYELRRIDCVSQLLYSGPDPTFLLESLRPKQHVSAQFRLVSVDGSGKRREGEWSPIGSAATMRDAPHPPHSLALSGDRKELLWSAAEEVLAEGRFTVTRTTVGGGGEEEGETEIETSSNRLCLSHLEPGTTYAFQVRAHCPWGDSALSETFRMSTPAEVPLPPDALSVEPEAQRELTVRWAAPDGRGSPVRAYHIRVEQDRQMIREAMVAAPSASNDEMEYRVEDLEADTSYRIYVAASNDVGTGQPAKLLARTRRPPPPPPALDGECEPAQIKLKWRAITQPSSSSSSPIIYRIARLAEGTDAHVPCYEGEYCSTKIKGLQENTNYRFQIRSYDRERGSGPWSPVFSFRTPLAPPPSIRAVPTATSNGQGSHSIEWPSVIPKGNPRGLFYRLQTHTPSDKKDQWKTVYEGGVNSFTLRLPAESSLLTRVFVVRPDGGTGIISQPSPPLHVSSIGETKEEEVNEVVVCGKSRLRRLMDAHPSCTKGILTVMALLLAYLVINYFFLGSV